jgi:hypothetical protein
MNNDVWVRLTDEGKQTLYDYYDYYRQQRWAKEGQYTPVWVEAHYKPTDGLYKFQFWNLMEIFGPMIHITEPVPFVDCLVWFDDRDLEVESEK